uniref:Uncharacterized protein n=1 Tax=Micrurus lemniscatus lemniscatus TaxID=129467 RepID=A0A2D4JHQ7_MICLE
MKIVKYMAILSFQTAMIPQHRIIKGEGKKSLKSPKECQTLNYQTAAYMTHSCSCVCDRVWCRVVGRKGFFQEELRGKSASILGMQEEAKSRPFLVIYRACLIIVQIVL